MPAMNAIEHLANIKNAEPKVKAMIMTAFDADPVKLEIQEYDYEIVELFQKPFTIGNLLQRVKKNLTKEKMYQYNTEKQCYALPKVASVHI